MMDLFEHAAAAEIVRRDRGMARAVEAQENCVPGFAELACRHICNLATDHQEIHIDLFLKTFKIKPEHPNAFGAPWMKAKREGIIAHSGSVRKCTVDPTKNAHLYPVYRSLICGVVA